MAGLQLGKTAAVAAQSGDNQPNGEEGRPNAKTILAPLDQPEAVVDVDGPAIKVAMHGPVDSERHPGAGTELGALGGELIDLIWNRQIGPGL